MEMEFISEFTDRMNRDRARQIIKRKRTKRQRPCSPFGDCSIDNPTPNQSQVMSSKISTEEDEDMANCLILLAQSVCPEKEVKFDQIRQKTEKLSCRRFKEMTTATADGKCGYFYVHECKTCNRAFPSFQALGGHRASHKKPKVNVEKKKSSSVNIIIPPPLTGHSEADHDQPKTVVDVDNKTSIIISNRGKIHECSICRSVFTSGQALGGHMRKHRPIPSLVNRTGSMMNTDDSSTADRVTEKSPGSSSGSSMLSLDLNFPPPEAADDIQSEFQFSGGSSQQHLVFSAPALVDCHY